MGDVTFGPGRGHERDRVASDFVPFVSDAVECQISLLNLRTDLQAQYLDAYEPTVVLTTKAIEKS